MIYNSFQFLVLYPIIFLLYYLIPVQFAKGRNIYLLVVSYLLYIQWMPIYALILFGVTAATYYSAILVSQKTHPKRILVYSVAATLAPLLFFKYFNFINDILSGFFYEIGLKYHLQGQNWAIPVGISFFTFQALGYLFDVYYKREKPEKDFITYALFVSFFPSILAGPINKASLVIPQLKKIRPYFDYGKSIEGLKFLLWGMFMKVVVADRVALYVDTILPNYQNHNGMSCFVASFLYSMQIYADFAGYSLMAIGVGKTLGFELTPNFRRPYFSYSVTDFWHRWHMSLSTWLKDYIYIPLGGSRCSRTRNYYNIFVTFFISGLWHGANWTYIAWGCLHGIAQIFEKLFGIQHNPNKGLTRLVRIVVTFLLVNFAWIFFRMPSLKDACKVISKILSRDFFSTPYLPENSNIVFMLLGLAILIAKDVKDEFFAGRPAIFNSHYPYIRWCAYLLVSTIIMLTGVFSADQFIYVLF